ncbi:hypothetical protein Mcup_1194 [Metallosphaera cuprina Ar-4]|uniref:Uncharacterized protein n=1 Tax=Metallosphaera cuprina (strain Ar-4) TaxID=1006006 RepID=F4G3A1_METCR|nr:hypothetical protein Mcup_1194 [Metallosphaera cuprina Ar-4]
MLWNSSLKYVEMYVNVYYPHEKYKGEIVKEVLDASYTLN